MADIITKRTSSLCSCQFPLIQLISEPATSFTPPVFRKEDCCIESSYFFYFEILFKTIVIYLKHAHVKDVHEGERTSKKARTMWQLKTMSVAHPNKIEPNITKRGILILDDDCLCLMLAIAIGQC